MNKKRIHMLIIDPQNDFCRKDGALFVTGADEDMDRLGAMIDRIQGKIDQISVTLDCHRLKDIAHPNMWVNSEGKHPDPFTIITSADVDSGVWRASYLPEQERLKNYVHSLEANKRYPLCIWNPHCLIGTPGNNIVAPVADALLRWEQRFTNKIVNYVTKGSNIYTEHYSAVQADVPDPEDETTMLNMGLIQMLQDADEIPFSGEALSHCIANTIRDIANNFGEENIKKFVLIKDTSSSVPGFEKMGEDFMKEMIGRGMKVSTSTDYYAQ